MKTLQKRFKFSKGEINPLLAERQDTSILDSSASYIKNYLATPYGGIRTRGGTNYIDRIDDKDVKTKIIPFVYRGSENYIFVLKNEEFDVYLDDVYQETVVATDLLEGYFDRLKYTQTDDALILTHPNLRPKRITKGSGGAVNFIPSFLTGEITRDGFTISSQWGSTDDLYNIDFSAQAYKAYDTNDATYASGTDDFGFYQHKSRFNIDFDTTTTVNNVGFNFERTWKIEIYKKVGTVYTLYQTQDYGFAYGIDPLRTLSVSVPGESWDGMRVVCYGSIGLSPNQGYLPRLYTASASSSTTAGLIFEDFPLAGVPKHAFDGETINPQTVGITPSAVEGDITITAASSIFTSDHVGQYIDVEAGTRVKITEFNSGTSVRGYTIIPFVSTATITSWTLITGYESVWSATRGYPNCCLRYQQRFWFGGSKERPGTVWGSRINDHSNFNNIGSYDNDGIDVTISGSTVGEIVNLSGNRGLQILTSKAEYISPEGSLTPNTITIIETTSKGSSVKVNPATINGITMFVDRNENSLLDFVYTEEQGAYTTREGAILNSHLIVAPVAMSVDNNSDLGEGNYLNMVMSNGEMITTCTLLEQKVNAFVRFITNGTITDVANLGSNTYVTVDRTNGVFLEKLTTSRTDNVRTIASADTIIDTDFTDETVRIYTDTTDYGTYTANASGEIDFSEHGAIGDVFIGYDIECQMISNKMQVNGQTSNIYTKIGKATLTTNNSSKITFNNTTKESDTDIFKIFAGSGYKRDNKFTISSTFDYLEVLSIVLNLNYGRG